MSTQRYSRGQRVKLGWIMGFVPYGDRWRDMRKAAHQSFNPEAVKRFGEVEVEAAHELLRRLVKKPDAFLDHARQ